MTDTRKIVPVILSGGSGTRLWPLSRTERPKQLLGLTAEETMLQLTARRTSGLPRFSAPLVVANIRHADEIEQQLAAVGSPSQALILEPLGRNTAPAIALAALALTPEALMLVMPSDHVIAEPARLLDAVERAVPLVEAGWLATFGIAPGSPETGYGYIKQGTTLADGVYRVERFVEKPDRATAERWLSEGGYAWNGGIFLFRADRYLEELKRHAPDVLKAARSAMDQATCADARIHPDDAAFAASPAISIDYAVMEQAEQVAVVPVDMGWSDVGSWDAIHALADQDEAANVRHGEVIAIDTHGCLLRTSGPVIAAVGVSDLIVIATGDAVLILPRGAGQEVKRAVAALQAIDHATLHRAVTLAGEKEEG